MILLMTLIIREKNTNYSMYLGRRYVYVRDFSSASLKGGNEVRPMVFMEVQHGQRNSTGEILAIDPCLKDTPKLICHVRWHVGAVM